MQPLFQVTTLSKVLAAIVFIVTPFIGGLIGYTYGLKSSVAPSPQIMFVQRDAATVPSTQRNLFVDARVATTGEKFGDFILEQNSSLFGGSRDPNLQGDISLKFSGTTTVSGVLAWDSDIHGYVITVENDFTDRGVQVMPIIVNGDTVNRRTFIDVQDASFNYLHADEDPASNAYGATPERYLKSYKIEAVIANYAYYFVGTEKLPSAQIVEILSLEPVTE